MKAISLWEMITSRNIEEICIPKIQRDYAQGRIGKELLRQRLLTRCKDALDNKTDETKHLLLDFVYGSKEANNKYYPLDGQQRLTTLWLLHWFVAFKAQELDEDTRRSLAKFSYETRRSSTDFCKFLCQLQYEPEQYSLNLREYIMSQTKFSAKWTLDPTVSAMLNSLCGTNITDKDNNDIIDGLSELFQDCRQEDFKNYFEILKSTDCPIKFYNLDMRGENLPLSDDLYIKMNARGKQLTDWENFKADLLDFVDNKDELGVEIDGCWTDLFWTNQQGGKIDAILFVFVNRYIFNQLLCSVSDQSELTQSSLYKLYGKESNDTTLRYEDFSCYNSERNSLKELNTSAADITKEACDSLKKLMGKLHEFILMPNRHPKLDASLDNHKETPQNRLLYLRKLVQSGWSDKDKDNFEFMPTYTNGGDVSRIFSSQRLVFMAVCRYFEREIKSGEELFVEEKFKDWVRFAWNISEYIRVDAMANAYRLINVKSQFCGDILSHLQKEDPNNVATNSFASEQLKEEIEKAKYISLNPDKKDAILKAERFRDLHGHIGFLFHDDDGDVNWDNFDKKFTKLQNLFNANNDEQTLKDSNILKIFLSYCTRKSQIESWNNNYSYIYDYRWESWRANFANSKYLVPTHKFLIGEPKRDIENAVSDFETGNDSENIYTSIYRWLLETKLMENVATHLKSGSQRPYLRRYYGVGNKLCLYPSAEGINMERLDRDKLLQSLYNKKCIKLNKENIFSDLTQDKRLFLKGWGINFVYNSYSFYWSWDNWLYIKDVKFKQIINSDNVMSEDDFIKLLDEAIQSQENIGDKSLIPPTSPA